jgi:LmbE family N-acetylglucosaminyl deacetylase
MEIKNKEILVICAHMDDEIYGMGGTLAKLADKELKNKINIIVFGHGFGGQDEERIITFFNNLDRLGINGVVLEYDDVTLETVSTLELCDALKSNIEMLSENPDIIFTHTDKDTHQDHVIVSDLVDIWSRNKAVNIFHFYVGGNTEWCSQSSQKSTNMFIDITGYEKIKKEMVKSYSEYPKNHPLNHKKIKSKDSYYGSLIGVDSAEIFEVKRICIG